MAFIPIPLTALVRLVGHIDSQEIINTTYWTHETGWASTSLDALTSQFLNWVSTVFVNLVHTGYQVDFVQAVDQSVDGGAQSILPPGSALHGSKGGLLLPNNVAYCVSFRTGLTGRSNRGRNYVPAISDADLNGPNHVTSTFRGQVVSGYQDLLPGGAITVGNWAVASRFHNKLPRTVGVATPINAVLTVDDVLDSQRRRLPGRGV
jgi:hypothetical protein